MAGSTTVHGVHHVCMKVADIGAAVEFYTRSLNYTVRFRWEGGAMLRGADGVCLEFFPQGDVRGYEHVAYVSEDVDADYAAVLRSGCEGVTPPKDVTVAGVLPVRIAFFRDPCGCLIELFHEKK